MGIYRKGEISLSEVIEAIKNNPDFSKAGAIGMFIGVVRGETMQGNDVKKLQLEAYEERAEMVLETICQELKKRIGVVDVQIHHFIGEFDISEDLVYVVVAGSHRRDVFPTVREAVERYKKEVPIWKKEYLKNGRSYWI